MYTGVQVLGGDTKEEEERKDPSERRGRKAPNKVPCYHLDSPVDCSEFLFFFFLHARNFSTTWFLDFYLFSFFLNYGGELIFFFFKSVKENVLITASDYTRLTLMTDARHTPILVYESKIFRLWIRDARILFLARVEPTSGKNSANSNL